eukprot:m.172038 g.172038  ORF g.172038 m.172038 type:complete len:521 (+) comp14569_c0_seq2:128-1690(+)
MDIDQDVVNLEPLPPISERLKGLRPSKELLEFYRQKVSEFEQEKALLLQKLDKIRGGSEEKHKLRWELAQREEEVAELQKALSDMQVFLFQEREHVLRLYAENDRLKLQEVEDRKKITKLLGMTQPLEHETTYMLDPEAHSVVVAQGKAAAEIRHKMEQERIQQQEKEAESRAALDAQEKEQMYVLTIEALKAQLEDQARLSKEQIAGLMEDRRVREEEFKVSTSRREQQIQQLQDKCKQVQELLFSSTEDFLNIKFEHRQALRESEEEKERLLRRIEELKDDIDSYHTEAMEALQSRIAARQASATKQSPSKEYRDMGTNAYRPGGRPQRGTEDEARPADSRHHRAFTAPKSLSGFLRAASVDGDEASDTSQSGDGEYQRQKDVMQETLADMYRQQCIQLEDELCRMKEERESSQDYGRKKAKSYAKRADMWKSRFHALEKRRQLEIEGYQTDIRMLRERMKELEKQLYRLALHTRRDATTDQMLQDVHRTTTRTSHIVKQFQLLKAKLHQLEGETQRA